MATLRVEIEIEADDRLTLLEVREWLVRLLYNNGFREVQVEVAEIAPVHI